MRRHEEETFPSVEAGVIGYGEYNEPYSLTVTLQNAGGKKRVTGFEIDAPLCIDGFEKYTRMVNEQIYPSVKLVLRGTGSYRIGDAFTLSGQGLRKLSYSVAHRAWTEDTKPARNHTLYAIYCFRIRAVFAGKECETYSRWSPYYVSEFNSGVIFTYCDGADSVDDYSESDITEPFTDVVLRCLEAGIPAGPLVKKISTSLGHT